MLDPERISFILNIVSGTNEHLKPSTKKEYMKVLALVAECLESKTIDYLPKIISVISKKLREGDLQMFQVISETIATVVERSIEDLKINDAVPLLESSLGAFFNFIFSASSSKTSQIGAALCITKIIQTSTVDLLEYVASNVTSKIVELVKNSQLKPPLSPLLEALLSLILGIEGKFAEFVPICLPMILENLNHAEWAVKKVSIDIIYSLGVYVPTLMYPYKQRLIQSIQGARSDKVRPVREAATMALGIIKEFPSIPAEEGFRSNDPISSARGAKSRSPNIKQFHPVAGYDQFSQAKRDKIKSTREIGDTSKRAPAENPVKSIFDTPINEEFIKNAPKTTNGIEVLAKSPPATSPVRSGNLEYSMDIKHVRQTNIPNHKVIVQSFTGAFEGTQEAFDYSEPKEMGNTGQSEDQRDDPAHKQHRFENFESFKCGPPERLQREPAETPTQMSQYELLNMVKSLQNSLRVTNPLERPSDILIDSI